MAVKKKKTYVRISEYGDLLVPIGLLERVIEECYIARTTYENSETVLSEIIFLNRASFNVHTEDEVQTVIATQKLAE
mgnify:FL=1